MLLNALSPALKGSGKRCVHLVGIHIEYKGTLKIQAHFSNNLNTWGNVLRINHLKHFFYIFILTFTYSHVENKI